MKNYPVSLRGHHLSRINALDMNRENFGKFMVKTGYSKYYQDSFAIKIYDFLMDLRQNPNQLVLVTAGTPDFICNQCLYRKKGECADYNPQISPLYQTAFWEGDIHKTRDKKLANQAGLEIGNIYSVKEIIKSTEEQTKKFELSLENC